MAYCPKCGKNNEDDSNYCNDCGASLTDKKDFEKEWEDRCEDECSGSKSKHGSLIWGLIVVCIGLWIVFELGFSNIDGVPDWLRDFDIWWIIPIIIGLFVISRGVKILTGKK